MSKYESLYKSLADINISTIDVNQTMSHGRGTYIEYTFQDESLIMRESK